jgi:hypothetical protein
MPDPKAKPEDVKPVAKPDVKPEAKPEPKAEAAPKHEAKASNLTPAGESTNPIVHGLLAELEGLRLNGDIEGADKILAKLEKLGYSAG